MSAKAAKKISGGLKEAVAVARGETKPARVTKRRYFRNDAATEALAEAWASFDGKLEQFRKGKTAKSIMAYGGHYEGYMAEAAEMRSRLWSRSYVLRKVGR